MTAKHSEYTLLSANHLNSDTNTHNGLVHLMKIGHYQQTLSVITKT